MKIQVLGSGCPTCKKLFDLTQKAVSDLAINAELEYVTDVKRIIAMGLMRAPALAIDEKPILAGTVPSLEELKEIISKNI